MLPSINDEDSSNAIGKEHTHIYVHIFERLMVNEMEKLSMLNCCQRWG